MIKYIISAIFAMFLTGCMYQTTSSGDILEALDTCITHGGINHITVHAIGVEDVICQDDFHKMLHMRQL